MSEIDKLIDNGDVASFGELLSFAIVEDESVLTDLLDNIFVDYVDVDKLRDEIHNKLLKL